MDYWHAASTANWSDTSGWRVIGKLFAPVVCLLLNASCHHIRSLLDAFFLLYLSWFHIYGACLLVFYLLYPLISNKRVKRQLLDSLFFSCVAEGLTYGFAVSETHWEDKHLQIFPYATWGKSPFGWPERRRGQCWKDPTPTARNPTLLSVPATTGLWGGRCKTFVVIIQNPLPL